ncbi:MAG: hypothetical protein AAGJ35_12565 [Myxococcota bacterium]
MDRFHAVEQTRFLGREFLLWLWFTSEEQESVYDLGEEIGEVECFFDDRIVMEPVHGEGNRHQLSGFDPATSPEAAMALQMNKIPTEVKLKVVCQAQAWTFALRGEDLQLRSLKIPEILAQAPDDQCAERLYLIEQIEIILGALWSTFLHQRVEQEWPQTLVSIQHWIGQKFQSTSAYV